MTVAEMIKKTRTENNLTQQEYAAKFYVSRQTVSSWENGKSMPELQTLIDICNTYKISLDALLNENHAYVSKITMLQKCMRILLKVIIPIVLLIIGGRLLYIGYWNSVSERVNAEFVADVEELGFSFEDKHYILQDEDTIYELPNQKLPYLAFHFYSMVVNASYRKGDTRWNIIMNGEGRNNGFSVDAGIDSQIEGEINPEGLITYTDVTNVANSILENRKEELEEILRKMQYYYKYVYEDESFR